MTTTFLIFIPQSKAYQTCISDMPVVTFTQLFLLPISAVLCTPRINQVTVFVQL